MDLPAYSSKGPAKSMGSKAVAGTKALTKSVQHIVFSNGFHILGLFFMIFSWFNGDWANVRGDNVKIDILNARCSDGKNNCSNLLHVTVGVGLFATGIALVLFVWTELMSGTWKARSHFINRLVSSTVFTSALFFFLVFYAKTIDSLEWRRNGTTTTGTTSWHETEKALAFHMFIAGLVIINATHLWAMGHALRNKKLDAAWVAASG